MNLKNKDITEGMRVTNGKYELRVVTWDKSYSDCLLNYLDSKGNRYVVAQNYKLSGTEKDPQIEWMNGRYFTANSDDEAFETYLDYLGEVHEYDISESKKVKSTSIKESSVRCVTFEQIVDSRFENISKGEQILQDRKDEIIELCGNNFSVYTQRIKFYDWPDGETQYRQRYFVRKNNNQVTWNDLYKIVNSVKAVPYDFDKVNDAIFESKKKLTESAKPINEKNVAKFVDEINEWCDDNIHYKDEESAHFTKEYGKLYDFKYDVDYSFGDKGDLLVYDDQGTLDWYNDTLVVPFIEKLAKKYGWYCEPCHSYADFMLGEL